MAQVKTKAFWQSSTLWINVIGVVAVVLTMVVNSGIVEDTEVVALIVAVLNIANRFRKVEKINLSLK